MHFCFLENVVNCKRLASVKFIKTLSQFCLLEELSYCSSGGDKKKFESFGNKWRIIFDVESSV